VAVRFVTVVALRNAVLYELQRRVVRREHNISEEHLALLRVQHELRRLDVFRPMICKNNNKGVGGRRESC
jgi:hypothetical protein